jgi:hypothetical protein
VLADYSDDLIVGSERMPDHVVHPWFTLRPVHTSPSCSAHVSLSESTHFIHVSFSHINARLSIGLYNNASFVYANYDLLLNLHIPL